MTESALSNDPGTQKRRSTRIVQAVPLTVTGVDALGQPFKERTTTVMVNCHGCKYQSKHYVPKNSIVTLDIPTPEPGRPPHSVQGRVVWVQRPRTVRELFQIGLEFETPGNVWGIAFPPDDWQASIAEGGSDASRTLELVQEFEIDAAASAPPEADATAQAHPAPTSVAPPAHSSGAPGAPAAPVAHVPSEKPAATPTPPGYAAPPVDAKIHAVTVPSPDAQAAIARQMARVATEVKENLDKTMRKGAETAIAEEMTIVRQQLDVQLHDAVERAIKVSMERVSETSVKKVVQEAAQRTAAIVEEARKATEISSEHLDTKVRNAVQQAVSTAAEQAAQQAAQQATAQNLKTAVEEAVERVISSRQAASPSLDILSSPEAAQRHLDDWRKSLEDTAQNIRSQTVEKANVEVAEVNRRWQETFDAALAGASQKIGAQLNDASRAALEQAQQDIDARKSGIQGTLDEVIASARSTADSLKAELEQERARTDQAKSTLEEAARTTLESVRAAVDHEQARVNEVKSQIDAAAQSTLESIRTNLDQERARAGEVKSQLDAAAQSTLESVRSNLEQERARADEAKSRLESAAQSMLDHTQQRLYGILAEKYQEIGQKADKAIAERAEQIEPTLAAAAQKVVQRITGEFDQTIASKLSDAHSVVSQLADAEGRAAETQTALIEQIQQIVEQSSELKEATHGHIDNISGHAAKIQRSLQEQAMEVAEQAAQFRNTVVEHIDQISGHASKIQDSVRENLKQQSDSAVQESLEQLRQEAAKVPAEVEQSCREVVSKVNEDIERKGTETEHHTYEALLKASEWYQKKAQTTMQTSMERSVEQATTSLRDRAAETSRLLASELDHYRRTYVEHSQAQIEEAAKEVVDRQRNKLTENAEVAGATFANQVNRVTLESLRRFEETSRGALEKARSDMEFNREGSLTEFQSKLDERMLDGVEQARVYLQSQLMPIVENWQAQQEQEKKAWMERLKKATDENIEHYKERLENASNSWLLASATTLGQHSQTVLDTIAKAAEKRLRDTCSEVLSGMGDTLKNRLLGLSADFRPDDEEDDLPKQMK
ncbi:MAG TPA: PilZ domain-containing protein [Candidatus Acidoferrales bacterium]